MVDRLSELEKRLTHLEKISPKIEKTIRVGGTKNGFKFNFHIPLSILLGGEDRDSWKLILGSPDKVIKGSITGEEHKKLLTNYLNKWEEDADYVIKYSYLSERLAPHASRDPEEIYHELMDSIDGQEMITHYIMNSKNVFCYSCMKFHSNSEQDLLICKNKSMKIITSEGMKNKNKECEKRKKCWHYDDPRACIYYLQGTCRYLHSGE